MLCQAAQLVQWHVAVGHLPGAGGGATTGALLSTRWFGAFVTGWTHAPILRALKRWSTKADTHEVDETRSLACSSFNVGMR